MRKAPESGRPIVVKIGSSSLAGPAGGLDRTAVAAVISQVAGLRDLGHPVVLVSSGAVAAGLPVLGLTRRPSDVPSLQAAAAVGQGRLMEAYTAGFAGLGIVAGQVLLTKTVLADRNQYLHSREALGRMLTLGIVPVVNENDTVVVDEIRLGDNDQLAAMVTLLVGAGLLVILTDTAGLFTADPRLVADAELLSAVRDTDAVLDDLRRRSGTGALGSGGVATKVAAARMAAFGGTPTVITSAQEPEGAVRAARGEDVGTWVEPRPVRLTARKAWIAFGLPAAGSLAVDAGAVRALVAGGKSLLAAGVVACSGDFDADDAVEVVGPDGGLVGKGLVRLGSDDLTAVIGRHSSEAGGEVIHRDDLVVLVAGGG
ncbi:MAG: glutamate 5-kinase [Actinobacteria bacterium]|nr:MAG: glutamate 5-kinase [Actinomycetota bacterium]